MDNLVSEEARFHVLRFTLEATSGEEVQEINGGRGGMARKLQRITRDSASDS
jgi:hypothetical protein